MFKWLSDLIARNDMTSPDPVYRSEGWECRAAWQLEGGDEIHPWIEFKYHGEPLSEEEVHELMYSEIKAAISYSGDTRFTIL